MYNKTNQDLPGNESKLEGGQNMEEDDNSSKPHGPYCNWTEVLNYNDFASLLKDLVIQVVYDIGFKSKFLPCCCPFQLRFKPFFDCLGLEHVIRDYHCCKKN